MSTRAKLVTIWGALILAAVLVTVAYAAPPPPKAQQNSEPKAQQQNSGAIFTTESSCDGTNINLFDAKNDVYLDGGPAHPGAAGLEDGSYYVQVTEPDGTVLGKTSSASVVVTGGGFAQCYQLAAILKSAPDFTASGFADTTNAGGEYKVWASRNSDFPNNESKTDNFKVEEESTPEEPDSAELRVIKYYDANANGINDDGQPITGWKVNIQDGINSDRFTPVSMVPAQPDDYTISEYEPIQTNWMHTTPISVGLTLSEGESKTVSFGNLCLGAGGGHTLGFWSNKNGEKEFGADDLALMVSLNLRNADGSTYDPGSYSDFNTWLLDAKATNMANMLSAQMAAMQLNVLNDKVRGDALIYAPGTTSASVLGFAPVSAVLAEANTELGLHGLVENGSPYRTYQEDLKNALDKANNNVTFVQATPCAFSFAD